MLLDGSATSLPPSTKENAALIVVDDVEAKPAYHSLELDSASPPPPASSSEDTTTLEQPIKHLSKTVFLLTALALCVAYWVLSGGLTLFNKWFFSHHGFPFPVLLIMCTMVMHSFITQCIVRVVLPSGMRQMVPTTVFTKFLLPMAVCSALEIASSNLALVKLSVSFHTMVHASKPVFFAIWSVLLGLETASWQIVGIVLLVALGVVMLSVGELFMQKKDESSFDTASFLLILFSCFISGLRWNVAQLMLQRVSISGDSGDGGDLASVGGEEDVTSAPLPRKQQERLTPINLLYYTSPFSALSLLPFFLVFELPRFTAYVQLPESDVGGDLFGFGMLVSVWALVMTLVEFYLVRLTSAVLFSFAAILKEIMVITIAMMVHGDQLPWLNALGFVFCVAGIVCYQRYKFSKYDQLQQQH